MEIKKAIVITGSSAEQRKKEIMRVLDPYPISQYVWLSDINKMKDIGEISSYLSESTKLLAIDDLEPRFFSSILNIINSDVKVNIQSKPVFTIECPQIVFSMDRSLLDKINMSASTVRRIEIIDLGAEPKAEDFTIEQIEEWKKKADKWDALYKEVSKYYCNTEGEYDEENPERKGDLCDIGEVAASRLGWIY